MATVTGVIAGLGGGQQRVGRRPGVLERVGDGQVVERDRGGGGRRGRRRGCGRRGRSGAGAAGGVPGDGGRSVVVGAVRGGRRGRGGLGSVGGGVGWPEDGHEDQDVAALDRPVGGQHHAGAGLGGVARLDADHAVRPRPR